MSPEARVVDLGCGIGRVLRELAPFCKEITGVDVSDEMIRQGRDYLESVPNARLLCNSGASLEELATDSVDFLYSLLCLIHVGKRNCFRYLREIKRVLRSDGRALLQFMNIQSPEGLEQFIGTVDTDFPLEFYTLAELEQLLGSVGLEIQSSHLDQCFINLVVVNGSVERWTRAIQSGVSVRAVESLGFFEDPLVDLDRPGSQTWRIENSTKSWQGFHFSVGLWQRNADGEGYAACLHAHAVLWAKPLRDVNLLVSYDATRREFRVEKDGSPAAFSVSRHGPPARRGPAHLQLSLVPAGYLWSEEARRLFAGMYLERDLELG
ncbi:MAG: class I SAM-dependent methyltransferase [Planctomycetota bacterium]